MSISIKAIGRGMVAKLKPQTGSSLHRLSWLQKKILKHQDDSRQKRIRLGSAQFYYRRPYELLHTYAELFEQEIYKFESPAASPFIVDCGANIGLSAVYFKTLYPDATVLAFEPDADNFELLRQNIQLNNLQSVECRQKAVWIHNQAISFSSNGSQASTITDSSSGTNTVEVQAERLADLIKNRQVDFLKIDIEGAETEVIRDCAPYLQNVQNLFVEYHGKMTETEKLIGLLQELNVFAKVYIKLAADRIPHPLLPQKAGDGFEVQLNIFCRL